MTDDTRYTRRALLAVTGTGLASLAGCTSNESTGAETTSEPENGTPTTMTGDQQTGTAETGTAIPAEQLTTPVAGDPDASVTVAVYEDFACPHCKTFNEDVMPQLRSNYIEPGTIRYEHHDFPIPVAQTVSWQAPSAARAVQATVGDEAFFEYADLLFANQQSLGPDTYASLAGQVDADGETVRTAAVERSYDTVVKSDRKQGINAGVSGTPTVFVDGEQAAASYDAISSAIEEA